MAATPLIHIQSGRRVISVGLSRLLSPAGNILLLAVSAVGGAEMVASVGWMAATVRLVGELAVTGWSAVVIKLLARSQPFEHVGLIQLVRRGHARSLFFWVLVMIAAAATLPIEPPSLLRATVGPIALVAYMTVAISLVSVQRVNCGTLVGVERPGWAAALDPGVAGWGCLAALPFIFDRDPAEALLIVMAAYLASLVGLVVMSVLLVNAQVSRHVSGTSSQLDTTVRASICSWHSRIPIMLSAGAGLAIGSLAIVAAPSIGLSTDEQAALVAAFRLTTVFPIALSVATIMTSARIAGLHHDRSATELTALLRGVQLRCIALSGVLLLGMFVGALAAHLAGFPTAAIAILIMSLGQAVNLSTGVASQALIMMDLELAELSRTFAVLSVMVLLFVASVRLPYAVTLATVTGAALAARNLLALGRMKRELKELRYRA